MAVSELKIPCSMWRGGTSKGAFFQQDSLPKDEIERDNIFLSIMGSPDPMQIDGLGGARSSTSKVMVVEPSNSKDIDIEYTFGAVGIEQPIIDYRGNCGNLTSAVGPFAIDEELVNAQEPITQIRMFNRNTKKLIIADIPIKAGKYQEHGDYVIDGVPGTGARIDLHFMDPGGAGTGSLSPTGNLIDDFDLGDRHIECSIVDVANPVVFVKASSLGLSGTELPDEINANKQILARFELIRGIAAEIIGFVKNREDASLASPSVPLIAIVAEPKDYAIVSGKIVDGNNIDLLARVISMQKMHHAYAMTAAICTASAAKLKGTVVNEIARNRGEDTVIIGHPKGTISPKARVNHDAVQEVIVGRTARLLMKGEAYFKLSGKRSL